ncbi:restriction endonuclease [Variovorax sp. PBL-E5]|uniref:restriction endonuclease n=1 Tax=Variovorax sp. PBL-E5 TaxID=434014 RepID=UPI0013195EA1|nr:restriction endonuclease [Variovorax sp. PBL-E5]VTU16291.1 hypothetical protein E5CHR_00096 [Variovorax sp. PBL-E5]
MARVADEETQPIARRKRTNTAEDFIELISMLPWWAGVLLAIISYVVLHAWDARLAAVIAAQLTMNTGLLHMFVYAGQFALPFFCLVGAAASAWRRHQRKALADNVNAGKTADVLDGMSWREFELLVGEGFRLKGFSVVETGGGGADGGIDLVLCKGGEKHLVQCKQWRAYKVAAQCRQAVADRA